MSKTKLMTVATMLALLAATPLLSACHTAAGAGEDVSNAGQVIKKDVQSATPNP
jgi:predicted small secreted protein